MTTLVTNLNLSVMFKRFFRSIFGCLPGFLAAAMLATACYDDSELRGSIDDLKSQLSQLQSLVSSLQNDDAVTSVTPNADGSFTITFKKSGPITIRNGKDGETGAPGRDGSFVEVIKEGDTYVFVFSDGTRIVLPRYSERRVLTFEDSDYRGSAGSKAYWTALVDDPQYGGPLLYNPEGYSWFDENNTFLSATVLPQDFEAFTYGFSSGGIAVSNYASGDLSKSSYLRQLERFDPGLKGESRSGSGHNGSDNFAVVFDAGYGNPATLVMQDGEARVIESLYVSNICYTLNSLINGDVYADPMVQDGFFKITATGYVGEDVTGTADFYLAKSALSFVTEWTEWSLESLGAVDKVVFTLSGSADLYGDWGLNVPAYFAIDDITVRVYPE